MSNTDWITALAHWLNIAYTSQQPEQHQAALMVGSILVTMPDELVLKLRGLSASQIRTYSNLYQQHCQRVRQEVGA